MTGQETLLEYLKKNLTTIYTAREAENIAKIVLEDGFNSIAPTLTWNDLGHSNQALLQQITKQLRQGIPWQYVLGQADFYGYKFGVNPATLIPRIETEELVHWVIQEHKQQAVSILDIGTGSGCIAITLKKELPNSEIMAVDVSTAALEQTQKNTQQNNTTIQTRQLDILKEEIWQQMPVFDVIVSNPPYIPPSEKELVPKHVLNHEPALALFVEEENPLLFYTKIAKFGEQHLKKGGSLYFEINEHFGQEVVKLLEQSGAYHQVMLKADFQGRERMVRAQKIE